MYENSHCFADRWQAPCLKIGPLMPGLDTLTPRHPKASLDLANMASPYRFLCLDKRHRSCLGPTPVALEAIVCKWQPWQPWQPVKSKVSTLSCCLVLGAQNWRFL